MNIAHFENGDQMPMFGLGTWKSVPGELLKAVKEALRIGYRHIDCAAIYGNEQEVGQAISEAIDEGLVSRDELWITSKLWNNAHQKGDVEPALRKTLEDLQIEYLDLYLIHWPVVIRRETVFHNSAEDLLSLEEVPTIETWTEMEDMVNKGLCRHIGVSNFSVAKLKRLVKDAKIKPEMNQVELHPYLQQPKMVDFCRENGVYLTAYAPLGSSDRPDRLKEKDEPVLLQDPVVQQIAARHGVSPAQVLISWALHRKTVVIPKSVNPSRLQQNIEATKITLTDEDMQEVAALDKHRRYVNGAFWVMDGGPYTIENLWDE